jgi:hypothetical protein
MDSPRNQPFYHLEDKPITYVLRKVPFMRCGLCGTDEALTDADGKYRFHIEETKRNGKRKTQILPGL